MENSRPIDIAKNEKVYSGKNTKTMAGQTVAKDWCMTCGSSQSEDDRQEKMKESCWIYGILETGNRRVKLFGCEYVFNSKKRDV